MNKSLILALAGALFCGSATWAAPVSKQQAGTVAVNYVLAKPGASPNLAVKSIDNINENLYLVNFSPVGYAIISADDCSDPVMAYSTESAMAVDKMPDAMGYVVRELGKTVARNRLEAGHANAHWTQLLSGVAPMSRADNGIEPIIKVNWDQSDPYNKYCPGEGKSKALVGCVAVAMSQAMSVNQSPAKPTGQVSYGCDGYGQLVIDFDAETPYDWPNMVNNKNMDHVARLLYHAGMSVFMNYGVDGSGIPSNQVYRISNALKNNFGYTDAKYYWRDDYRGDWDQLLLNELMAGRAIVYNGVDTKNHAGHSFNLDGFDGEKYHINWGWAGNGNGYFDINNMSDAQQGQQYDASHVAVVGINAGNASIHSIELSDMQVEEDTPGGAAVAAVMVNGKIATEGSFTVELRGRLTGGSSEVPFKYSKGIIYTTRALSAATDKDLYVLVKVTNTADKTSLTQGFSIDVTAPQTLASRSSVTYDRNAKAFVVKSKFGTAYTVKNAQGAVVASGTIAETPNFTILRSALSAGDNTVELVNGSKSKTFKIKL